MEEKEMIKGNSRSARKGFCIVLIAILLLSYLVSFILSGILPYNKWELEIANMIWFFGGLPIAVVIDIIIFIMMMAWTRSEIVVTNKRIYGKSLFGRQIDITLDSICAVAISGLGGITVSTSGGKARFYFIEKRNLIHSAISILLMERQDSKNNQGNFLK